MYLSCARVAIRGQMIHRSAYWAGVVGQWLSYGATFATLFIMTRSFHALAGWNAEEVLFLYGINVLSYALAASLFFNPCTGLAGKIRTGEFDIALTKPLSPFSHEFCMGFNFGYVSHVTLSLGVLVFAGLRTGLDLTVPRVLLFAAMLMGATLTQGAFLIGISALSFFLVNENPFFDIFWTIKHFINYPLHIYPALLQVLFTFVVPLAFMNFYPAVALLGKDPGTVFPIQAAIGTPLAGLLLFAGSIVFWNRALSAYQSTGT
jgi:ABC-2 type transport system permease protein